MTPLSILARRCGMTHSQVAEYFSVSLDTVRSWSSGRRGAPPANLYKLALLSKALPAPTPIPPVIDNQTKIATFPVPTDDAQAKKLGYPTVGDFELALGPSVTREVLDGLAIVLLEATVVRHSEREISTSETHSGGTEAMILLKTNIGFILSLSIHDKRGVEIGRRSYAADEHMAFRHIEDLDNTDRGWSERAPST